MTSTKIPVDAALAIRPARADDSHELIRLAALDSVAVPDGPVLLALVDGTPYAAIEIETGRVAADPFRHTTELVGLLRSRAERLRSPARKTTTPSGGGRARRVRRGHMIATEATRAA